MNKFENVDVLASLQQIMRQNTAAFQNDFDIDKKILTRAAKSKNAEDKVYLWFSRPNGTHCLRERDVFLRGTREPMMAAAPRAFCYLCHAFKAVFHNWQENIHLLCFPRCKAAPCGGKQRSKR